MALAGGHPFETVETVTVMTHGDLFAAGALLRGRHGLPVAELTTNAGDSFWRLHEGARVLEGRPLDPEMLDVLVATLSSNPQEFGQLVEKDRAVEHALVMPQAAVLARWGPKGERAARRL